MRKIWEQPRIRLRQGYGVTGYADYPPSRYGCRGQAAVFRGGRVAVMARANPGLGCKFQQKPV